MGVIMLGDMENLKILSVFHKKSKPFGDVKSRSVSCFAVRVSGTMRYIFDDKEYVVNQGEMIFLKKGSCYKYKAETEGDSLVTIINLEGVYDDIEPNVYSVKDLDDANNVFDEYIQKSNAVILAMDRDGNIYFCKLNLQFPSFFHFHSIIISKLCNL